MKLTRRDREDLLTLIDHSRRDIHYGPGGTYSTPDDDIDKKAVRAANITVVG